MTPHEPQPRQQFCSGWSLNCQVQLGKKSDSNVLPDNTLAGCNVCSLIPVKYITLGGIDFLAIKSHLCFVVLAVMFFRPNIQTIIAAKLVKFYVWLRLAVYPNQSCLLVFERGIWQRESGCLYLFLKFLELFLHGLNLLLVIQYLVTFIFPKKNISTKNAIMQKSILMLLFYLIHQLIKKRLD